MWICMNDGFVSIVESSDPERLLVRARRLDDLENFVGSGKKILVDAGTDYKYRTTMSREEVTEVLSRRILNIDYTNFKGSTKSIGLYNLYVKIWRLHNNYQL